MTSSNISIKIMGGSMGVSWLEVHGGEKSDQRPAPVIRSTFPTKTSYEAFRSLKAAELKSSQVDKEMFCIPDLQRLMEILRRLESEHVVSEA